MDLPKVSYPSHCWDKHVWNYPLCLWKQLKISIVNGGTNLLNVNIDIFVFFIWGAFEVMKLEIMCVNCLGQKICTSGINIDVVYKGVNPIFVEKK